MHTTELPGYLAVKKDGVRVASTLVFLNATQGDCRRGKFRKIYVKIENVSRGRAADSSPQKPSSSVERLLFLDRKAIPLLMEPCEQLTGAALV